MISAVFEPKKEISLESRIVAEVKLYQFSASYFLLPLCPSPCDDSTQLSVGRVGARPRT